MPTPAGCLPNRLDRDGRFIPLPRLRLAMCLAMALPLCGFATAGMPTGTALPQPLANTPGWRSGTTPSMAMAHIRPLRANATTHVVDTCSDAGSGSLREAAGLAVDGDVIDLTSLQCATITLVTGGITLAAENVTLIGPGAATLAIDGADQFQVLHHTASGLLTLHGMTLQNGKATLVPLGQIAGGCVKSDYGSILFDESTATHCHSYSPDLSGEQLATGGALFAYGYVSLQNSRIVDSVAKSRSTNALGGAIFAGGDVTLVGSQVSGNLVRCIDGTSSARGGAIFAGGNVVMTGSTVDNNKANSGYGAYIGPSFGGGLYIQGNARGLAGTTITASTISGNSARNAGGVELLNAGLDAFTSILLSSTVSGNYASSHVGGFVTAKNLDVSGSTIAFNTAMYSSSGAGGLQGYSAAIDLQSTIIANNVAATVPFDFDPLGSTVTGSHNLIMATSTPPTGTIGSDPHLQPLANNGGATKTHLLSGGSPALDQGLNPSNLEFDQRGAGYPRVLGSAADIGATETDFDQIFANGFEPGG